MITASPAGREVTALLSERHRPGLRRPGFQPSLTPGVEWVGVESHPVLLTDAALPHTHTYTHTHTRTLKTHCRLPFI